tara:strand:+ start:185 stop:520 length:336 start_codon:yes stop_codon:yes gene_type:complete
LKESKKKTLTYTKNDIVRRSAGSINLTQKETKIAFDSIIETIYSMLTEKRVGSRIEVRNLGVFTVRHAKQKTKARNPKTNKIIFVPDHRKIHFKPSKRIKEILSKEWKAKK